MTATKPNLRVLIVDDNRDGADALKPEEINALGFMLGDKKAGPFKMEIKWIKVERVAK